MRAVHEKLIANKCWPKYMQAADEKLIINELGLGLAQVIYLVLFAHYILCFMSLCSIFCMSMPRWAPNDMIVTSTLLL